MKKVSKLLGVLLTSAMLASAVPFGAAAEGGTVNLIPITDGSLWEAQAGDNDYKELNADGTWISAAIDSSGAVTLKRTANAKDGYLWPRIRMPQPADSAITIDLSTNPYIYYDLTAAEGTKWNLGIAVSATDSIGLAKGITNNTPGAAKLANITDDGAPGTYTGKLNLKEYLDQEYPGKYEGEITITYVNLFVIDASADGVSGQVTYNKLMIGPDGADTDTDVTVTTLAGGDNKTTAAGGNTTTTAKAAADNPKTGENDTAALFCLAAGAVALTAVTLTVSRKKGNRQ